MTVLENTIPDRQFMSVITQTTHVIGQSIFLPEGVETLLLMGLIKSINLGKVRRAEGIVDLIAAWDITGKPDIVSLIFPGYFLLVDKIV